MNKLEVGMYVRTKNGTIFKIVDGNVDNWFLDVSFGYLEKFEENWLECYRYNDNNSFFNDKNIKKTSYNIIDLIEVGDIISYEFPTGLGMIDYKNVTVLPELLDALQNRENSHEYKIISIVTKEQFERMEYEVE